MLMNVRSDHVFDATVASPTNTSSRTPLADRGFEIRCNRDCWTDAIIVHDRRAEPVSAARVCRR